MRHDEAAPPPSVFDRFELPAASALLGWTLRAIDPEAGTIEIGWRLAPEYWGKGYVTEAAQAWTDFGFEALSLDEIVSFAVWNNVRSTAVMERLGMLRDTSGDFDHPNVPGTHPHLRRHVLYRLSKRDWRARNSANG